MSECNIDIETRLEQRAQEVIEKLKTLSLKIALAESCTAGLITSLLANTSGASSVLWGSFVCYMQEAKVSMLGIDSDDINAYDLVSRETSCLMAQGALKKSGADIAAAVTGIAGPGGDGSKVPVGTVWIAVVKNGKTEAGEFHFNGSRKEVRMQSAQAALEMILSALT